MAKAFISATRFQVTIDKAALLKEVTAGNNGKVTGREIRKYVVPIIEDAQKTLIKDLEGYEDYCKRVKARVIPYLF